jgi:hypothetical protein
MCALNKIYCAFIFSVYVHVPVCVLFPAHSFSIGKAFTLLLLLNVDVWHARMDG